MSRDSLRLFLVTAFVVFSTGCATYQPADLSDIAPDDEIRLELEQQELGRLLEFADPATRSVDGRYVEAGNDSVSVVVRAGRSYTQVQIPRGSILGTSRRVVDNTKSFVVSALIVGGVAALAVRGFEGRDGGPVGDGGGIDETRIPFFGLRIPFSFGFGRW